MSATVTLLLEIGVEELPSSFVDAALAALPALASERLPPPPPPPRAPPAPPPADAKAGVDP